MTKELPALKMASWASLWRRARASSDPILTMASPACMPANAATEPGFTFAMESG